MAPTPKAQQHRPNGIHHEADGGPRKWLLRLEVEVVAAKVEAASTRANRHQSQPCRRCAAPHPRPHVRCCQWLLSFDQGAHQAALPPPQCALPPPWPALLVLLLLLLVLRLLAPRAPAGPAPRAPAGAG